MHALRCHFTPQPRLSRRVKRAERRLSHCIYPCGAGPKLSLVRMGLVLEMRMGLRRVVLLGTVLGMRLAGRTKSSHVAIRIGRAGAAATGSHERLWPIPLWHWATIPRVMNPRARPLPDWGMMSVCWIHVRIGSVRRWEARLVWKVRMLPWWVLVRWPRHARPYHPGGRSAHAILHLRLHLRVRSRG